MEVKLVAKTVPVVDGLENAEDLISYCARVSNPSNQLNTETAGGLLKYCLRHKHFSIFETANLVMEIQTTRDISRQILRHRSFSFQEFCIDENSLITTATKSGRTKKVAIKDLYKRYNNKQYWDISDNLVRVYDELSGKFTSAKIKEVFDTGRKPVYKLTLDNGKTVTSTKEHKILTKDGFKVLEDITENDFVACNGDVCYQNFEWLKSCKERSLFVGGGLDYMAKEAGCSKHTIRKWLKRLDLCFTKKESAKLSHTWNKGLPKEQQPMYGRVVSEETRDKMRESSRKGSESEWYKGAGRGWRKEVADYWLKYKNTLLQDQNFKCKETGETINLENSDIDHLKPVFSYPELAYERLNVRLVTKEYHKEKTMREIKQSRYVPKFSKVISVDYVGERQTYDLEVDHTDHNYIADGIVTHNSQRYASVDPEIVYRETRIQDVKNKQNSIVCEDDHLCDEFASEQKFIFDNAILSYNNALEAGIAKEQARALLPEGLTSTRMYMNGTLRSWLHFCQVRCGVETQKECRLVAKECCKIIIKEFPCLEELMTPLLKDSYSSEK